MTRPCDEQQPRTAQLSQGAVRTAKSSRWSSDDEEGDSTPSPTRRRSRAAVFVEGIEVTGLREKLPRPLATPSVEAVYSTAGEKEAESPTAQSPREQNKTLLDSEKMAPRKFLWTTLDSVVVRPAEAAANLPLPLAAVCSPFADNGADSIPLSLNEEVQEEEPLRCPRCWCYANSFWKSSKRYERRLQCNMCDHHMELPEQFWKDMESTAWNPDEEHHPELAFGSVDFQAPQHFDADRAVKPRAPVTCFLLEATSAAARTGFLPAVVRTLDSLVQGPLNTSDRQVGLITFDDTEVLLHVPTRTGRFRAVAMTDPDDPYVPVCPERLFVWPDARGEDEEGDPGLADLLFQLAQALPLQPPEEASAPSVHGKTPDRSVSTSWELPSEGSNAVARAALRVALEAVSKVGGGDVLVLSANADFTRVCASVESPRSPGSSPRSPRSPSCSPKKGKSSASLGFGFEVEATDPEIAELCVRGHVAISAVTAPEELGSLVEVEVLHWLAWRTGGEVFHFASFTPASETELAEQLWHWSTKMSTAVYGCVFKLRCSKGLLCRAMTAAWPAAPNSPDRSAFEIPRMTGDATVTFSLLPDYEALDDDSESPANMRRELYLQAAILYTNARGERMLRVHNCTVFIVHAVRLAHTGLSLPPLVALLLKQSALRALEDVGSSKNKVQPKDFLLEVLLKLLGNYHRFSRGSSEQVLATGRKLHLLPLYLLAARKLLYSLMGGSVDKYTAEHRLRQILKMPVHSVMASLYPRVYALPVSSTEEVKVIPSPCPAMLETIVSGHSPAYLITNGFGMWFYRVKAEDPGEDPQQTDEELWQSACELGWKIYESTSPAPWAMALRPLPTPMTSGATPYEKNTWQERVLLSTLFIEDEGVSDAGYAEWVQFLHEELGRQLE